MSLEGWNLVKSFNLKASLIPNTTNWEPLTEIQIQTNSPTLLIYLDNPVASESWYSAGKIKLYTGSHPHQKIQEKKLTLKDYTLFESSSAVPYSLISLWFYWWHKEMQIRLYTKSSSHLNLSSQLKELKQMISDISETN